VEYLAGGSLMVGRLVMGRLVMGRLVMGRLEMGRFGCVMLRFSLWDVWGNYDISFKALSDYQLFFV
jgi:hypothetical protein